jgi:hypothetical protein
MKVTPAILQAWDNTIESKNVATLIGKRRKLLHDEFAKEKSQNGVIAFSIVKDILERVVNKEKNLNLNEEKWRILLRGAEKAGGMIDTKNLLNLYKERLDSQNLFPL